MAQYVSVSVRCVGLEFGKEMGQNQIASRMKQLQRQMNKFRHTENVEPRLNVNSMRLCL